MARAYINQEYKVIVETGIDLTSETDNTKMVITKPDGTQLADKTAVIESPATGGLLSYTFPINELSTTGDWQAQGKLDTQKALGVPFVFSVFPLLQTAGIPLVEEIRAFLEGYCATETKLSSNWIDQRRDAIVDWIEKRIGLVIGTTQTYTEYISGTGSNLIWTSRRPIVSLDSIRYVEGPQDNNFFLSLSAIEVDTAQGMLKALYDVSETIHWIFPRGNRNILITYTAGLTVDAEIREAILCLVSEKILTHMANQNGGGATISTGGYTRNYGARGKFTDMRNDLARMGISYLRPYFTSVGANG